MEKVDTINYHETKFINRNGNHQTIKIPIVQDLSRVNQLPRNFIRNHDPTHPFPSNDTSFETVNMAEIRASIGSPCRIMELEKLVRVAKEWGMFVIENHGLDIRIMESVETVVRGFFELPFEEKRSSVGTYTYTDNIGYGRNFIKSEDQPLDWIDRLVMKAAPEGATEGLNVWPNNPVNFRPAMEEYVKAARKVMDELLEALAEALSLERRAFLKYFDPKLSEINVRVNYYPPSPRPDLTLGVTPHSDGSALTMLAQFKSFNGLQVLKDDKWVTVPWPRNALLINLGDFIEIMSNGRLKSSWHRAGTQSEMERYSVALFYNPPSQTEIGPVEDGSSVYEYKNVMVGDYMQNFYKISPTVTKEETMMFAKQS